MPQLCLKEIVMGKIASNNMLFYPKNAQMRDVGNNEAKMLEQRGSVMSDVTRLLIDRIPGILEVGGA